LSHHQTGHIFYQYVSGSKLPNETGELKPKARASALDSGSFSGLAEILAGESSADEVNGFEFRSGEFSDVSITLYSWPVLCESSSAPVVNLDLPAALEAGPFETEVDAAYPSEQ
jgi:hypothetical protein